MGLWLCVDTRWYAEWVKAHTWVEASVQGLGCGLAVRGGSLSTASPSLPGFHGCLFQEGEAQLCGS